MVKEVDDVLSLMLYHQDDVIVIIRHCQSRQFTLNCLLSCEVRVTLIVFVIVIIELLGLSHCHWGSHFLELAVVLFIELTLLCCYDRKLPQKYFNVFVCFSDLQQLLFKELKSNQEVRISDRFYLLCHFDTYCEAVFDLVSLDSSDSELFSRGHLGCYFYLVLKLSQGHSILHFSY